MTTIPCPTCGHHAGQAVAGHVGLWYCRTCGTMTVEYQSRDGLTQQAHRPRLHACLEELRNRLGMFLASHAWEFVRTTLVLTGVSECLGWLRKEPCNTPAHSPSPGSGS